MTASDETKRVDVDIGRTVVAQEEPVRTKRKGGQPWTRLLVAALCMSVLCSAASVAVYDRFFAQKVVTANIAQFVLDRYRVLGQRHLALRQHGRLTLRVRGPLVELGADLSVELPDGPATPDGFSLIEGPRRGRRDRHQMDVVGPGERENAGVCRS